MFTRSWIKSLSLNKENLSAIKRQSNHWIKLWCIRSAAYYNNIVTYKRYCCSEDIITKITFSYTSITNLWTEFLQKLCGNLFFWAAIFLDSYFYRFGVEPLDLQESIREKIDLVTIHLQEWIFTYQDNFEINVLVSVIFKISRECNLTDEIQIHNIRENRFNGIQGIALGPLHKNWWKCVVLTAS